MAARLTKAQRRALERLARVPPEHALHCTGRLRIACARLAGLGLADFLGSDKGTGQFYVINQAGRAALAEAEGKGGRDG